MQEEIRRGTQEAPQARGKPPEIVSHSNVRTDVESLTGKRLLRGGGCPRRTPRRKGATPWERGAREDAHAGNVCRTCRVGDRANLTAGKSTSGNEVTCLTRKRGPTGAFEGNTSWGSVQEPGDRLSYRVGSIQHYMIKGKMEENLREALQTEYYLNLARCLSTCSPT